MPARPRVILWDLMDTLVRDPFFTHVAPFFGMSFEALLREKLGTAWRDFELGMIDEDELYARFFADGRAIDGPGLKATMIAGYAWIDGMRELLTDLHARGEVAMHLLSNYPPWYTACGERLGVFELVEPTFVSCKTFVRKPAPEAYLGPCRALGVAPEECLFVDDREVNCAAARALGMPALRFDGDAQRLRESLRAFGFG